MLHIPILRHGQPYTSVDQIEIVHHATGEPFARVSQANPGLISRDIHRMDYSILDSFSMKELLAISKKAGQLYMNATLPVGDQSQSFDDYIRCLSATTGMPVTICRNNASKIFRIFDEMDRVIAGLTRGFDLSILDQGYGDDDGRVLSWFREARVFGAVLPSNSPGVHSLWIPALALKTPTVLKPGREEPWSPLRILESFAAAGLPRAAFGFYPTDHGGASTLLQCVDRAMLFGDAAITKMWSKDPRVELHGPGYSKVLLGDDTADHWEKYIDIIASSIAANGGRSCINASAVWTPRNGDKIAQALAAKLATIQALPAEDPSAQLAAFANPRTAVAISGSIDAMKGDADEITARLRGTPRLVQQGRLAWLLPTIIRCDIDHPLANKEYLFPFASVIECPTEKMPEAIGPSLVVSAISSDPKFTRSLMASHHVDRLNLGPVPTWKLSWDQPHEGNLFQHLYRQRAFQAEPVG